MSDVIGKLNVMIILQSVYFKQPTINGSTNVSGILGNLNITVSLVAHCQPTVSRINYCQIFLGKINVTYLLFKEPIVFAIVFATDCKLQSMRP